VGRTEANGNGRTNAHRSEVAAEDGLPECLDVRNPLVESNHDRQAPEEQDKDSDDDQPPDGDGQDRVVKVLEGRPGSDVDEASDVEEKVDDGTEDGLLGLSVEEAVPSESSTATESGKEIIGSQHCASADHQKSEGDILSDV
jgi:hypothetical protein